MEKLLSVQDVADYMSISENTARQLVQSLPHINVGKSFDKGLLRIRESVVEAFVRGEITREEKAKTSYCTSADPYYGLGPPRKRGRPRKSETTR